MRITRDRSVGDQGKGENERERVPKFDKISEFKHGEQSELNKRDREIQI